MLKETEYINVNVYNWIYLILINKEKNSLKKRNVVFVASNFGETAALPNVITHLSKNYATRTMEDIFHNRAQSLCSISHFARKLLLPRQTSNYLWFNYSLNSVRRRDA